MTDSSKIKVLIVDDEPAIRESISQFLVDFNFHVITAENGETALRQVQETPFDIAIVDMRLPEMSGDSFILKAHGIDPSMKFLILTGSLEYRPTQELFRIGVGPNQILKKPLYSLMNLVKTIETITRKGGEALKNQ